MCFRPPAISTDVDERECPQCGTINDGDETSCIKCNAVLISATAVSAPPPIGAPPPVGIPNPVRRPTAPPSVGAKQNIPKGIPKIPKENS